MEGFPTSTPLDTKMDIDVSKPAEPRKLSLTQDPGSIPTLDGWIENLMSCKQLSEADVSRLCDRVSVMRMLSEAAILTIKGEGSASRGVQRTASRKSTATRLPTLLTIPRNVL